MKVPDKQQLESSFMSQRDARMLSSFVPGRAIVRLTSANVRNFDVMLEKVERNQRNAAVVKNSLQECDRHMFTHVQTFSVKSESRCGRISSSDFISANSVSEHHPHPPGHTDKPVSCWVSAGRLEGSRGVSRVSLRHFHVLLAGNRTCFAL